MDFYSYLWLREDGTPWYAGKGSGKRAYERHKGHYPPRDRSRILIFPAMQESEAFASEKVFIDLFGRKDLGTGCLYNYTDGGDGWSGAHHTENAKKRIVAAHIGKKASAETRLKQSLAKKGKPSARKGYKASPETILKQIAAAKLRDPSTRKSWSTGKHLSDEHKQKQSAGLKKFWATHERLPISEETRQKMSIAKLGTRFHLGFKNSEESKQKMRASALARRARERDQL